MFLGMGRDLCFFWFWGNRRQNQKKTWVCTCFLNSYVSLRNNFTNGILCHIAVHQQGTGTCSWIHGSFQTIHCQRMFHMRARTKHSFVVVTKLIFQPCSERVRILKKLPWTSIFSSDKIFPVSLSFC